MSTTADHNNLIMGLESKYFNDAEIFEQVKSQIFYKTWQMACHCSQVEQSGDYFSLSIFDQDVFVVRDQAGELHGLYNVCQHRGHKLVDGQGNKRNFVCPYHAWNYSLDGQLQRAPNCDKVSGFDVSKIRIPEIKVEEFLGFAFINLDPNAPPMDECYPGVKQAAEQLCNNIKEKKFAHMHDCSEGCNWLIAIENYNECYHCKMCHREFAKGVIDPESYRIEPFNSGKVLRHSSKAPQQDDSAWMETGDTSYGSFYLWPATSIQIYPGGIVNSYHWRPLAIDDTRVHRGWYSDDGRVDENLQKVIELDKTTTFAEDLTLVKNVQRGVNSMGYTPGPLIIDPNGSIDSEASIAALHRWMRDSLEN